MTAGDRSPHITGRHEYAVLVHTYGTIIYFAKGGSLALVQVTDGPGPAGLVKLSSLAARQSLAMISLVTDLLCLLRCMSLPAQFSTLIGDNLEYPSPSFLSSSCGAIGNNLRG